MKKRFFGLKLSTAVLALTAASTGFAYTNQSCFWDSDCSNPQEVCRGNRCMVDWHDPAHGGHGGGFDPHDAGPVYPGPVHPGPVYPDPVPTPGPGPVFYPPNPAMLASECVNALASNSYYVSSKQVQICQQTRSPFALDAIRAVAQTKQYISDPALSELTLLINQGSLDCVRGLVLNQYDISAGQRAAICRQTESDLAGKVVSDVARTRMYISDMALRSLVRANNPLAANCIAALTGNQYEISTGTRAATCLMTQSPFAVEAVRAVAEKKQYISDPELSSLVSISNPFASAAVKSLAENSYDLSSGKRAQLCANFRSQNAVNALNALAYHGDYIADSTLESISKIYW